MFRCGACGADYDVDLGHACSMDVNWAEPPAAEREPEGESIIMWLPTRALNERRHPVRGYYLYPSEEKGPYIRVRVIPEPEPPQQQYRARQDGAHWAVVGGPHLAHFYGPDARAEAEKWAAAKNAEAGG